LRLALEVFGENMTVELTTLLGLIEKLPGYRRLLAELAEPSARPRAVVLDAAKSYLIAALYRKLQLPMLVVTAQPRNSQKLHEQLSLWCHPNPVRILPEPEALLYERITTDPATEMERLRVLFALASRDETPLIVTSAPALAGKTTSCRDFTANIHTVYKDTNIEPLQLLTRWEAMGYRREGIVEVPGTISQRGGIVDIYPPSSDRPARLEFFGNTVESIRLFDPATQRSQTEVPSVAIGPATELLTPFLDRPTAERVLDSIDLSGLNPEASQHFRQEITMLRNRQRPRHSHFYAPLFNQDSILSYLPDNALVILDEPGDIELAIADLDARASQLRQEKVAQGELPREFPHPYFTNEELNMESRRCLALSRWDALDSTPAHRLEFAAAPDYAGQLPAFINKTWRSLKQKNRVVIISHEADRLSELLDEADIIAPPTSQIRELPQPGSLTLIPGTVAEGWVMGSDTWLFTDAEIFGFVKQPRPATKRPVPHHKLLVEITPGDYVVHIEHGIGRFAGVTTMTSNGSQREYLVLHYAGGDRLYVPTDQIDRVSRYIGASDQPPNLSRLGTQEWTRAKQRVQESAEETAQELLSLYATREVVPGFAFSPDVVWQQELESSFPYVETPDQIEAIRQVKEDMAQTRPMDRLVAGDVGYGKTEVAMRAAFKAIMDGKQVAVLVPTTVLAEQHLATFSQRLEAFPVNIEVLSRFRTAKEQQAIIDGLARGTVDICIGTHRLLQKDVVFKDLGLVIIDEEQRFGVRHKEHFKQLRQEVDVLTLSATPIPRTLYMSLVGARDMSTMETPPEERLPIKTYVAEYDERLIREAVLREMERNGQVFFIHNRVQSIAYVARKLQLIVPEASIAIAHGQMPEGELAKTMADFARGDHDILVCTTIIESGMDMPNVNTLIVNQADRFGLTQLYQLRGRVGRGANLAFAYFLHDKGKRLTPTAEKRLKTIYQATELGAGFDVALKDLEIRGAGNLLGTRQSGHITAVGFSLYCRLLAEAVEGQKAKQAGITTPRPSPLPPPTIDLPLPAFIPEYYVADVDSRLHLYQRLAKVDRAEQLADFRQEFTDRFGTIPAEVENLLYAVRIKLLAMKAGIESVSVFEGQLVLRLFEGMQFSPEQRAITFPDGIKIGLNQIRLNLKRLGKDWGEVLEGVLRKMG
jgi:transcription-repair coupling factor (superfamily II helicase)